MLLTPVIQSEMQLAIKDQKLALDGAMMAVHVIHLHILPIYVVISLAIHVGGTNPVTRSDARSCRTNASRTSNPIETHDSRGTIIRSFSKGKISKFILFIYLAILSHLMT